MMKIFKQTKLELLALIIIWIGFVIGYVIFVPNITSSFSIVVLFLSALLVSFLGYRVYRKFLKTIK
jgi:hypothetical protein